jgi:hypothetical protein
MIDSVQPLSTPIVPVGEITWSPTRRAEPVTTGIPLPEGVAFAPDEVTLTDRTGRRLATQVRPLDYWPDRSIRWALLDYLIDSNEGHAGAVELRLGPVTEDQPAGQLHVDSTAESIRVSTGVATFGFVVGGSFPVSDVVVANALPIDAGASGLEIECDERLLRCRIAAVKLEETGSIRAAVEVRGVIDGADRGFPLEVLARVEAFSGSPALRMSITLRNKRRARHRGGYWPLGDPGSVLLKSAVLALKVRGSVTRLDCADEFGQHLSEAAWPFTIHQESSGGENWKGPVHRERDGQVSLRFRGYRRRDGDAERTGYRATPIVVVHTAEHRIGVTMPNFWQNFPRAISVRDNRIEIGFFPTRDGEPHELQGGEQKSHVAVVAFGADQVSEPPLAWVHDPVLIYPQPGWCCETGVIPFLVPAESDPDPVYRELVASSLDTQAGFLRKRELADEYGWRNFGDLPADHESAFLTPGELLVSHYNNQYDAVACFAIQFLRSGDRRWWQLMNDLACHVRDIDIYHTDQDKAAYNGGLFWHTWHYFDAGTSTHRSYPRESPMSGGPSAEHNYNVGLMLHYFMTGEPASRAEAVNLGRWVIRMDDGQLTVFNWLARGPTGLASASGSMTYHGAGRGAANSILACLVAYRLTGEETFNKKAEELIRRCIHPIDDIESRNLLDVERRWFYTMFLQVLGWYLHDKAMRRSFDEMYFFARESLLHYARWIERHERPYLDKPEILEYPNETWAAQDLRKADALMWAALHVEGEERHAFLSRASFFQQTSLSRLRSMPTHRYTRPTVLVLANGVRFGWYSSNAAKNPPYRDVPQGPTEWADGSEFEPQKTRAFRRARLLAVALGLGLLSGAVLVFAAG